jgi:hypothetical protein
VLKNRNGNKQDILLAQSLLHESRMGLITKQAQRSMPIIPQTPCISSLTSWYLNRCLSEVIGALLECKSAKQILNMNKSDVPTRPFKGEMRNIISRVACPIEPHFQEIEILLLLLSFGMSHLDSVPFLCCFPLFLTLISVTRSWSVCRKLFACFKCQMNLS